MSSAEQWIGPSPCTGRSRIEDPDALLARLTSELRAVRRAHAVSRFAAAVAVLSTATWFAFYPGELGRGLATIAAVGAMILGLGPVGALMEILFAPGRVSRLLFASAAALAVAGYVLDRGSGPEPGFWGLVSIVTSVIVITFGGVAALVLRMRDRPRRMCALRAAEVDARRGDVLVFEAAEPVDDSPRRLEVLPLSGLLYRVDGHAQPDLSPAPMVTVGTPDEGASEPTAFVAGSRRALSSSELTELGRVRKGIGQQGIWAVVFAVWGTLVAFRFALALSRGFVDTRINGAGAVLALAAGGFVAVSRIRVHRRLSSDLRAGVVERIRERNDSTLRRVEVLPDSRFVWSVDDTPASWRTYSG